MLKDDIEEIVSSYCDGTYNGLSDNSYFVESKNPLRLVDDLVTYVERLLTKRAAYGAYVPDVIDIALKDMIDKNGGAG